jgi:two-component system cell cycle sensor histidine kinase/response regulator CckA
MAMILVVDDDDSIRELILKIVRSSGHDALPARNGLEAVAMFRSCPDSIDLVITDLKMPVMDGNEAVRRIRETRPHATIICVSGYSEQECPVGTMFLSKPFTVGQVRTCVGEALAVHVQ